METVIVKILTREAVARQFRGSKEQFRSLEVSRHIPSTI